MKKFFISHAYPYDQDWCLNCLGGRFGCSISPFALLEHAAVVVDRSSKCPGLGEGVLVSLHNLVSEAISVLAQSLKFNAW